MQATVIFISKCLQPHLLRRHPGTLRDPGVRPLRLQTVGGRKPGQPQRGRTMRWREGQEATLLRHLEEHVGRGDGGEEGLLAGRRQLLRQVVTKGSGRKR